MTALSDKIPANAILTGCKIATLTTGKEPYGLIENAALAIADGKILDVGEVGVVEAAHQDLPKIDLEGRLVTPGLVDCHTHVVFGGDRAREFEMRLEGASYEEIAREGGGIVSTVKATRTTSEEELLASALKRVDSLMSEGITTIEIKSGYGLDVESELKMLRVAKGIGKERSVRVKTSYLAAHALPPEYKDRAKDYIKEVCIEGLKAAVDQNLVDAVDGFCEGIAFSPEEIEPLFKEATNLGVPVKLHAEQLSNLGGAKLAARYNALSADHLEYLDEDGVKTMADAGTVAVILPGAFYTLRETQAPPIDLFRKYNVAMAVATDCNPGSSPLTSILTTMNMACTFFRMTPEEALIGVTRNAAGALGLEDTGIIKRGMRADLAIWDLDHPRELSYRVGLNPLHHRIVGGQ